MFRLVIFITFLCHSVKKIPLRYFYYNDIETNESTLFTGAETRSFWALKGRPQNQVSKKKKPNKSYQLNVSLGEFKVLG